MRNALIAIASLALVSIAPAQAQDDMKCDKDSMAMMEKNIKGMEKGENMNMAMKHMDMAQDAMEKGDMKGCMEHMQEAQKSMKM